MPETEAQLLREIDRMEEWVREMEEMLVTDDTVPGNMWAIYNRQFTDGLDRLAALKTRAKDNGWI
jgi:hypothetical protein